MCRVVNARVARERARLQRAELVGVWARSTFTTIGAVRGAQLVGRAHSITQAAPCDRTELRAIAPPGISRVTTMGRRPWRGGRQLVTSGVRSTGNMKMASRPEVQMRGNRFASATVVERSSRARTQLNG